MFKVLLKAKQLTYCSQIKLLLSEIDLFLITIVSFNSTDKISQLYSQRCKKYKSRKKSSIKIKAIEGIPLVQQSKGYIKFKLSKNKTLNLKAP